jgi:hypothetical protein
MLSCWLAQLLAELLGPCWLRMGKLTLLLLQHEYRHTSHLPIASYSPTHPPAPQPTHPHPYTKACLRAHARLVCTRRRSC